VRVPNFFIHTLRRHKYMRLKFNRYEFDICASLKVVFIHFLKNKNISFSQAMNKYAEDCIHQISFKINEKYWRNFKFSSQVFNILVFLYCYDVTSFHQKIKMRTTKVRKEDFI
jgi:hypothetical protein